MKKYSNLFWGALFFLLLGVAYLVEEKKIFQTHTSGGLLQSIQFNRGQLKVIGLPQLQLHFTSNGPMVGAQGPAADDQRIQELMEVLSSLKVKREIQQEELAGVDQKMLMGTESSSPSPPSSSMHFFVELANAQKADFRLGQQLPNSSDFYLEIQVQNKKEILVVEDLSPFPQLYIPGQQDQQLRFQRLQAMINAPANYYYHARPMQKLAITKLTTHWEGGPSLEIQFDPVRLVPAAPGGLELNTENFQIYRRGLNALEAKASFPQRIGLLASDLGEKIGALEILSEGNQRHLFFLHHHQSDPDLLWLENKNLNDYYLLTQSDLDKLITLSGFFWKKIPAGKELGERKSALQGTLKFRDGRPLSFTIPSGQVSIQIETPTAQNINARAMSELLKALLGLPPVGEAFRVSELSDKRRDDFVGNEHSFELRLEQESFLFDPTVEEVRILQPSKKLVFHYLRNQFPMIKWEQSFFTASSGE